MGRLDDVAAGAMVGRREMLVTEQVRRTLELIRGHSLEQGAFAQQVARRYLNNYSQPITDAINARIPQSVSEGSLTRRRLCTQPFTYNQPGLMEGAESEDHSHDVGPRHVRHLVELISQALGGTWEPARRRVPDLAALTRVAAAVMTVTFGTRRRPSSSDTCPET